MRDNETSEAKSYIINDKQDGLFQDYKKFIKIGQGSFASVYRAQHITTNQYAAIKSISLSKLNKKLLINLESEINIMRTMMHENILRFYGIRKAKNRVYMLLEYCNAGDLAQYLKVKQRLNEIEAIYFLKQLSHGLYYLHSRHLIHRDLKPQNLLLTNGDNNITNCIISDSHYNDLKLKIADFGFARHLATSSMAETLCGSPLYMAPEILKYQRYDSKADLWSVGTIFYQMVIGKPPFGGRNHIELLANIEKNQITFPSDVSISDECVKLLKELLKSNPLRRMSFDEFFQSNYISQGLQRRSILEEPSLQIIHEEETISSKEEDEDESFYGSNNGNGMISKSTGMQKYSTVEDSIKHISDELVKDSFLIKNGQYLHGNQRPSLRVNPFKSSIMVTSANETESISERLTQLYTKREPRSMFGASSDYVLVNDNMSNKNAAVAKAKHDIKCQTEYITSDNIYSCAISIAKLAFSLLTAVQGVSPNLVKKVESTNTSYRRRRNDTNLTTISSPSSYMSASSSPISEYSSCMSPSKVSNGETIDGTDWIIHALHFYSKALYFAKLVLTSSHTSKSKALNLITKLTSRLEECRNIALNSSIRHYKFIEKDFMLWNFRYSVQIMKDAVSREVQHCSNEAKEFYTIASHLLLVFINDIKSTASINDIKRVESLIYQCTSSLERLSNSDDL